MTHDEITQESERRYWNDTEFHARVELTVQVLNADLLAKTGQRISDNDISVASNAAAVALVIAERRFDGGVLT